MTTVTPGRGSIRSLTAAEARAALGRARITPTELARRTHKSQAYWWRRLTAEETALDVEDLSMLGEVLDVPLTTFLPETQQGPRLRSGGEGLRGLPRLDSDQQPSVYGSLAFAA